MYVIVSGIFGQWFNDAFRIAALKITDLIEHYLLKIEFRWKWIDYHITVDLRNDLIDTSSTKTHIKDLLIPIEIPFRFFRHHNIRCP